MTMKNAIAQLRAELQPDVTEFLMEVFKATNRQKNGDRWVMLSCEKGLFRQLKKARYIIGRKGQIKLTKRGYSVARNLVDCVKLERSSDNLQISDELGKLLLDASEAESRIAAMFYTVRTVSRDTIMTAFRHRLVEIDPKSGDEFPRICLTGTGAAAATDLKKRRLNH
jgi:hypothetical protein